mmetsp:Transcript_104957/g.165615  ORF Transcript_104957/g.165615 Transcript_104957/m.165615 type:complete len:126 (-) Transcript_104957:185-562(-)
MNKSKKCSVAEKLVDASAFVAIFVDKEVVEKVLLEWGVSSPSCVHGHVEDGSNGVGLDSSACEGVAHSCSSFVVSPVVRRSFFTRRFRLWEPYGRFLVAACTKHSSGLWWLDRCDGSWRLVRDRA